MSVPQAGPELPSQDAEFSFAYAGLFFLAFSLTQAGLMLYYRSGLYVPGRLLLLAVSLFTACAFAPSLLPGAGRKKNERSLYLYPLLSLSLLLFAFIAFLPGNLGRFLVYVYAGLGILGFFRGLPRLRRMNAAHYAFLGLAVLFGVYVFYYFNSWNYAGVLAPEHALLGAVRKDTYYAAAIAHMLQNFGESSTGMDGLVRLHYHVGSHAWFAALGRAAGAPPLLTYPFIHMIVLIPAQFLALSFAFICATGRGRSVVPGLGWILVLVFLSDAWGRPSHYVSESYAAGITALLFFWPLLVQVISGPEPGRAAAMFRFIVIIGSVFIINSIKISVGILWTIAVVWVLLRQYRLRAPGLVVIALSALGAFIAFKIFNDPGQAAVFAPLRFYATHPRLLFLSNWIFPGLFLIAVARAERIRDRTGLLRAFKQRRTLTAEALLLIALASALPSLLLVVSNAWAWFFFNVPQWPALAMLAAKWDFRSGRHNRRRHGVVFVVSAVLIAAAGWLGFRHLKSALKTESLQKAREFVRTGGSDAEPGPSPARPYGTELDSLLASAPGYRAYCLITDAARQTDGPLAVYAPPSNQGFWGIVRNCEAQSLFVPAVTGKPMLFGVLPQEIDCRLRFYGYPDYGPGSRAREANETELCQHARKKGFAAVFVLNDLYRPELNKILDCSPGPGTR